MTHWASGPRLASLSKHARPISSPRARDRGARIAVAAARRREPRRLASASPAPAWIGAETGYETHDWFIDQAVALVGSDASWFDIDVAREATDDLTTPSITDRTMSIGTRAFAAARSSASSTTTTPPPMPTRPGRYDDASREIGLLSHYYTDILQPYHAHYSGMGQDRTSTASTSSWSCRRHQRRERRVRTGRAEADTRPPAVSSIRAEAIAAAAYSRATLSQHSIRRSSPPRARRSPSAIERDNREPPRCGVGVQRPGRHHPLDQARCRSRPARRPSSTATVKWRYPAQNEDWQHIYTMAYDASGRPIEGLEVRVTLPNGRD